VREIEVLLDAVTELGEGPIWDAARERLLFVDIMRGLVHEFDPRTGADRVVDVGQPVGAVAPTARGDWIAAVRSAFVRIDPGTGRTALVAAIEDALPGTRMNDGLVDPRGRFWAGSMGMGGLVDRGRLYRLDPDGSLHTMLQPVGISNGIDWSPDARLMYYADTPTGRVDVFDFHVESGRISNRRPFVVVATGDGYPDGLVVDAEGAVWLALWEGGALRRYLPDGRLDAEVRFPASCITKCAFGGANLDELYVTSAWIDLDDRARAAEPHAGSLFRLKPGVRGRPSTAFG
jgi:sugar lactone lactonase YvrE